MSPYRPHPCPECERTAKEADKAIFRWRLLALCITAVCMAVCLFVYMKANMLWPFTFSLWMLVFYAMRLNQTR